MILQLEYIENPTILLWDLYFKKVFIMKKMTIDIEFWLYTKQLDYYLLKKDFDNVDKYLSKKKELAKILREIIKEENTTLVLQS